MEMENLVRQADWEAVMRRCAFPDFRVIAADWQQSGLCAQYLTGAGRTLRAGLLLADGEYMHRRNGGEPELFFCRMMRELIGNMPKSCCISGNTAGTLFLIGVPQAGLALRQAQEFSTCLEQTLEPFVGEATVVLMPRIRAVWEHCYGGGRPDGPAKAVMAPAISGGVIQILEEETQFLFGPGKAAVVAAFGSRLAGNGPQQRYYNRPVRYRENNYLYEADRFLWQDAAYASWYQAFYQISKRVLAAQTFHGSLMLTGDPDCMFCAEKALADMDAVTGEDAGSGRLRAMDVPAYLLEWYCRIHGRMLVPAQDHFAQRQDEREGNTDIWAI